MNTFKSILAISTLLAAQTLANAALYTTTGSLVNPANGHSYFLLSSGSWTASETAAQTLGGHLVTINDATENRWVANTFRPLIGLSQPSLWIGLNDAAVEGTWVWASGETAAYRNWAYGEPNNTPNADPTGEDYASIRPLGYMPDGSWNDLSNTAGTGVQLGLIFGVVEVVPEPQSLALLSLGLIGFWGFRKRNR